jgi:tRNA A-37 threonylcarbamoyl transferase component Bud32
MVVMELLEGAVTWQSSMQHPTNMLREAVKKLHGAGFVHGDIRDTNILISNERQV